MSSDLRAWLDDQGALYPTVRATGAPVPPPTPLTAEPPPIVMTFALGRDPATPDAASHQLEQNGLTMQMTAVGSGGLLDWNNNGVGVNSTLDSGTATDQRRINGALSTPESIHFSFDADVAINSMLIGSISAGTETLILSFVSGTNPFTGLAGYSGDYQLTANSLMFTASSGTAPLLVPFGEAGQDDLFVSAGTVLAITANPATGQGILFDEITVERILPTFDGDYNHDNIVDAADYVVWRKTDGTRLGITHGGLTSANRPAVARAQVRATQFQNRKPRHCSSLEYSHCAFADASHRRKRIRPCHMSTIATPHGRSQTQRLPDQLRPSSGRIRPAHLR